MISFFQFNRNTFKEFCIEHDMKPYVADQMFSWVYKKGITNNFSNISKKDQELIRNNLDFSIPKIDVVKESFDGTVKFLMEFEDKEKVETVLIFSEKRVTICLSSQVGCAMGCKFCHTATQGLKRHLKCSEIVGQYFVAQEWVKSNRNTSITNIVFMGQGEPLHNPKEVKTSIEIFLDPFAYYLGQRKITLSTSGLAKEIENFKDFPPINLAISLHSTRDEVRSKLMPINKAYNLETLFRALSKVPLKAHRRITYEYLLIDGVNDQTEDVHGLIRLLNSKESKINLIPFNEFPGSEFKRPSDKRIDWFMRQLISNGFCCTIRQTKGPDILAACGQLKSNQKNLL